LLQKTRQKAEANAIRSGNGFVLTRTSLWSVLACGETAPTKVTCTCFATLHWSMRPLFKDCHANWRDGPVQFEISHSYDYTPKDRGFEIRWGECSSIDLILPAALDPGVYSAFDRNEYQKQKNNVSWE
jgi:hypothetical protein